MNDPRAKLSRDLDVLVPASDDFDVRVRHRLLRQPDGFEGLPAVSEHIPNDPRVAKREDGPYLRIHIRPAGSAPTLNPRKHDDVLARIDALVDPGRECLEGVREPEPSTEGLAPDSLRARVRESRGAENDFATVSEEPSSPAPVASLPMFEDVVYDLHVLLGHRLPP